MTVRVAAAVLAALALVAAALPAVEHAAGQRDAAALDAAVDRTADAVGALVRHSDPGDRATTAPRRTVRLDLPADAAVAVESNPPRVVATAADGTATTRRLAAPVRVCGGGGGGDDQRLRGDVTLAYVDARGGPVVVALRGFISGNGSTPVHACTPGPRSWSLTRPGLPV